jgi:hypothetical protein
MAGGIATGALAFWLLGDRPSTLPAPALFARVNPFPFDLESDDPQRLAKVREAASSRDGLLIGTTNRYHSLKGLQSVSFGLGIAAPLRGRLIPDQKEVEKDPFFLFESELHKHAVEQLQRAGLKVVGADLSVTNVGIDFVIRRIRRRDDSMYIYYADLTLLAPVEERRPTWDRRLPASFRIVGASADMEEVKSDLRVYMDLSIRDFIAVWTEANNR